jgi:four helix bundle protein
VPDFRRLKVWERSHQLALAIYKATAGFPREEQYGLTSQMRRSAFSVPANIAEGCGRGGSAELARFLLISVGSASELEYHLLLAKDLELLDWEAYAALNNEVSEIKRMLASLIRTVRNATSQQRNATTEN